MPEHDLQSQLEELRYQLAQDTPLTDEERASLQAIAQDIEVRLATQGSTDHNDSLVDASTWPSSASRSATQAWP